MTAPTQPDLLDKIWEYPLFEALYARRSRRFGLGFEMPDGPFKYKSTQPPLPLSDLEEALLVAAGIGFSGIALWDQSRPLPYRAGDGRTFPSTSRGRRTALFFTNDRGVYVIDPAAGAPTQLKEVEAPDLPAASAGAYAKSPRYSSPSPTAQWAQPVGLEHARFDVVHAGLRRELFSD